MKCMISMKSVIYGASLTIRFTVNSIMKDMKFYGSTTVGERGQIVLPAKLRNDFHNKRRPAPCRRKR